MLSGPELGKWARGQGEFKVQYENDRVRTHFPAATYPLVNVDITMENHNVQSVNPSFLWPMAIFHSYFDIIIGYQRVLF